MTGSEAMNPSVREKDKIDRKNKKIDDARLEIESISHFLLPFVHSLKGWLLVNCAILC